MPRPEINWNISLGNMLVVLGMVVSIAVGYGTTKATLNSIEEKLDTMEAEGSKRDLRITSNTERISIAQTMLARHDERWNSVVAIMNRVENRLERIEQQLDRH